MRTGAVLAMLLTACASTPVPSNAPSGAARGAAYGAAVEEAERLHPLMPIAVPREAPPRYVWRSGPETQSDASGYSIWAFASTDGTLPIVELCVIEADVEPEGTCYADDDAVIGERRAGDLRVLIVSMEPSRATVARPSWRGIGFTTDWRSVGWLRASG